MLSICRVDQALGVGRQAPDVDAAIVGRCSGSTHSRMVGGEVGLGHPAADALEIALDRLGDLALVEGVAPPPSAIRR